MVVGRRFLRVSSPTVVHGVVLRSHLHIKHGNMLLRHCCLDIVGLMLVHFLGRSLLLSVFSVDCAMKVTLTRPSRTFTIILLQFHMPKPSPVSLPILAALHHASGARGDASCSGCEHGRRGEEAQADLSKVGGWRTLLGAAEQGNRSRSTRGRGRSRGLQ